ncbi:MAG: hypothetical protein D6681_06075 [Calditrichaeota bacterium]|nr:MAG: hypothetical protein D6681_06075 [Calditrichota bacterium]
MDPLKNQFSSTAMGGIGQFRLPWSIKRLLNFWEGKDESGTAMLLSIPIYGEQRFVVSMNQLSGIKKD